MYNALIVDDEPYIADGLTLVIREEIQDIDVYTAYCGNDVLQLLDRIRIDIIILDVQMPDISGIELHQKIIKKWPNCKVIYHTAHDNFNYVRHALQSNAVDYLLKTSRDDVVISTVRKTMDLLDREKRDKAILLRVNQQLINALPQIRHDFFNHLINDCDYTPEDLGERFSYLEVGLDAKEKVMILIARKDPDQKNEHRQNPVYMIREVINDNFNSHMRMTSIIHKPYEIIFFLQPCGGDIEEDIWNKLYIFVQGTLERIQSICRELFNTSVSFALSRNAVPWNELRACHLRLTNALNYGFGFDKEILIDDKYLEDGFQKSRVSVSEKLKSRTADIDEYLENNDIQSLTDCIDSIIDEISQTETLDSSVGIELFYMISAKLMSYMNIAEIWKEAEHSINIKKLTDIGTYTSWDDVKGFFKKAVQTIIDYKFKRNAEEEQGIVARVNQFINDNLDKDISLAAIAEYVHFNPFYLSRLYKKMANRSISEYITEVRLYVSKKYLRQTDMKIKDIVKEVGFSDQTYFARFFKGFEHMTPSEYRNSH